MLIGCLHVKQGQVWGMEIKLGNSIGEGVNICWSDVIFFCFCENKFIPVVDQFACHIRCLRVLYTSVHRLISMIT